MSEILIQGTYMEVDKAHKALRDPYGSNRSGKSLSIFQDPNASQTLARDEEITMKMYDNHDRGHIISPEDSSERDYKSIDNLKLEKSPTNSKVIMKRVSGSLAEGQKLSNGDPVELSGFTYHNGAVGSGVENNRAAKQHRAYTSHSGGGMENKYSRHSATANKATKTGEGPSVRRTTEGRAEIDEDRISRASSGFLFEGHSHLNGGEAVGEQSSFSTANGEVGPPEIDVVKTTTTVKNTSKEGPTVTVTQTTTQQKGDAGGVKTTQTENTKSTRKGNVAIGMKGDRKAGAFSMKPASNWTVERSESTSSAQSHEFKASLDDTLSRKLKAAGLDKSNVNGDDGTLADTESINGSRTNSMQRRPISISKVSRSQSGASQKSGLTDGSSIPEDVVVHNTTANKMSADVTSTKSGTSYSSNLSRLVQEEDNRKRKAKTTSSPERETSKRASDSYDMESSSTDKTNIGLKEGGIKRSKDSSVGSITNGGNSTDYREDTIDRLVREESERGKRHSPDRSSSGKQKTSTPRVTTTKTVSSENGSQSVFGTTNYSATARSDNVDGLVRPLSASAVKGGDHFIKMEHIANQKEGIDTKTRSLTKEKVEKKAEEGIDWFATADHSDNDDESMESESGEEHAVQEEMSVSYKSRVVQSDPYSEFEGKSQTGDTHLASKSSATGQEEREAGKLVVQSGSYSLSHSDHARGKTKRVRSPTAAAASSDEFKSKLTSLMNSPRAESDQTVAEGKNKKNDWDLTVNTEAGTNIHGDGSATNTVESSSLSRNEGLVISASPASPLDEARSQVREGTVGKIKHAFKNINLTGGLAPSTLERKKQTDTSETESDTGKKFKFAVEGIDVPARETSDSQTDTAPSTLSRDGHVGSDPLSADSTTPVASPVDTSDADTLERKSLDRKKKGFSYLPKDLELKIAGEIKRRADTVQATKPHEALDAKESRKSQLKPEEESAVLLQARAKLQHKDLLQEISSRKTAQGIEEESDLLKEAKARLTRRQQELSQSRKMEPPPAPSPIHAHMLLAQRAKLQKRSDTITTSEPSSETSEAESNKNPTATRSKLPSQKKRDPNRPLNDEGESLNGNKTTENTVVIEATTSKKVSSAPTDRKSDIPDITVQSTRKTDINNTVLKSTSVEKRNSQSFSAKPKQTNSERQPTPDDPSQHVQQTSSAGVKTAGVTEVNAGYQQRPATDGDAPDSAYQSDAPLSPGLDIKPLLQTDHMKHPPVQEVEVRYARNEPVASTSRGGYEATRKVVRETKTTTKTVQSKPDGRLQSNEEENSTKAQYSAITKPESSNRGQTQMKTTASLVTTSKNKQIKDGKVVNDQTEMDSHENTHTTPISQEDIINAALSYKPSNAGYIDEGPDQGEPSPTINRTQASSEVGQPSVTGTITSSPGSQRPSSKTQHSEAPQIKVTSYEEDASNRRQTESEKHTQGGPYTFSIPVRYEDSGPSSPSYTGAGERDSAVPAGRERAASSESHRGVQPSVSSDITILNSSIPRKTGTSRRDSYDSSSTYGTTSSYGSHRVVPLKALSVDVGQQASPKRREMKTHPHSPGARSPTRSRHYQMSHSATRTSSPSKGQKQKAGKSRNQNMKSESRSRREKIREDHLEVNIYGDEEDDHSSIPSAHSPPNRYMKVDEGHSGRVPRYRIKDIHVRNSGANEAIDYNSSVERSTRGRSGPHVSNVIVDGAGGGDYVDYDSGSAFSEPTHVMGRNMGKYSIQKVMDRRGVNEAPMELHPDNVYRKHRVYQVNRSASFASNPGAGSHLRHPPHYDGTMRSNVHDATLKSISTHAHSTDAHRSAGIAAVDPDLLAARKTGTDYNVSLKLNAMQVGRADSKMSWEQDELNQAANVTQYQNEYRHANGQEQGGKHVSTVYNAYDDYNDWERGQFFNTDPFQGRAKTDDFIVTSGRRGPNANLNNGSNLRNSRNISRSMTDTREIHHQQFKQVARGPERVDIDIELAPEDLQIRNQTISGQSAHFQRNTKLRRSKSDPSMARKFQNANLEPKFSMTINQTMTMDYTPQEHELDDNNNRGERRPQRRAPSPESYSETEEPMTQSRQRPVERPPPDDYTDSDSTIHEEPLVPSRKGMNERPPNNWPEEYLSPADMGSDSGDNYDDMPQVVRGSILIQNAIDPGTGGPHIIDVVDDESDDEYVVDDNTNMFDRRYHATKNNPLYDSDNESPERPSKPRFTDIFQRTSQETVNGYDVPDNEWGDSVTKTTTYNVHSENRGRTKSRPPDRGSSGQSVTTKTEWEINKLLAGAPADSIKQTINVEREEEEIMGPLPANHADGSSAGPDGLLNFDTVSEKVDLGMLDGKAQVAVKVRCERIVPIRGVDDMFKKSSVIVTRLIEIDLTATDERRRLYEHIMRNQNRPMITAGDGAKHKYSKSDHKLSTKETFKLYKTFMGLAEADEAGKGQSESLKIDRKIDEEHRPDLQAAASNGVPANLDYDDDFDLQDSKEFDPNELERQLEDQLQPNNYQQKVPEADTISYSSAAPSTHDLIY